MNPRLRELLRVGRCGPVARPFACAAARLPLPGADLLAFGLLGKPRRGTVEVIVMRDGVQWDLDLRDDAHRLMLLDLYERELRRRALARLPVGGTFVDAGANVGFWSVPAAQKVGPGGRVVAFEPNPWAVHRLGRNVELNRESLAPVEIVAKALGDVPGTVDLLADDLEAGASRATLYAGAVEAEHPVRVSVPVTTLDEAVHGDVDLLKMDVQGHELAVLAGGRRLFSESPPTCLVVEVQGELLAHAGVSPEQLVHACEELGYRAVDGDGRLGHVPVARPLPPEFFETVVFQHASA